MIRVIHKKEVVCDLCCKPIAEHPYGNGLFGTRFTMIEGIFGKSKHADICFDCQQKIIQASNGNKKD